MHVRTAVALAGLFACVAFGAAAKTLRPHSGHKPAKHKHKSTHRKTARGKKARPPAPRKDEAPPPSGREPRDDRDGEEPRSLLALPWEIHRDARVVRAAV